MLDDLDVLRVLLASLLFAAATAGLGRMVRPPEGLGPADLAVGLGVLGIGTLILSRLGLGLETSVSVLLLPGFLLFLLGMRHWRAAQFSLRVSALHAPLVILSAAIPLIAWDDFSHWLRNALFLQQWDSFPGPGLPPPDS